MISKRISFWRFIRKTRQIKELVEITIELIRYITKEASDPKLVRIAKKIRSLLKQIFNKDMIKE